MSNVSFGKAYKTKIKELIKLDFVKKVTEDTEVGDTQHHLAHSGVIKEGSTATLRITYGWFMQTEGEIFFKLLLKNCQFLPSIFSIKLVKTGLPQLLKILILNFFC